MTRLHTPWRTIAALILLAVVAAVCVSLGNWQLRRAAEREGVAAAIQAGREQAPLRLAPGTPRGQLQDWRRARASGIWLDTLTVLLANRNHQGRPGFWVATPLLLQADSRSALLVLRGWIPRPPGAGQVLPPPAARGGQAIEGQLVSRVPRLFELWTFGGPSASALPQPFPAAGREPPQVQNLDLSDYARATGLQLLPVVLEQTSAEPAAAHDAALVRDWPLPSIDADQNRGYALQWFSFAAIAGAAWLVVAWRALKKRRVAPPSA